MKFLKFIRSNMTVPQQYKQAAGLQIDDRIELDLVWASNSVITIRSSLI